MRASALTKMIAALGIALLFSSSDICLLVTCAPAQARLATHAMTDDDCGGSPSSKSHHNHGEPNNCSLPCNMVVTLTSGPQLTTPVALSPVALPAVLVALLSVDEPVGNQLLNEPAGREHSPPSPPLLDASGVRAPPIA